MLTRNDVLSRLGKHMRCADAPCPPGAPATLFSADTIQRLFSPFAAARGIVLAISGGPDSVALMLLAAEWAREGAPPLFVATVDHGLREESRAEAERVAGWAAQLLLPQAILAWEGTKPNTRIQERARQVRYELLFQHAARLGADYVMTAHHADDQAETILFRLLRGSGLKGLSGMARSSLRGGFVLARPLLDFAKADLKALCEAKAHPYLTDPANEDPRFARTRVRRLAGVLATEGLDRTALLRFASRVARAETALAAVTRDVRSRAQAKRAPGFFSGDISSLAGEPDEIVLRFLADELKLISRGKNLRLDRLERFALSLGQSLRAKRAFICTIGGFVLRLHKGGTLIITQEAPRHAPKAQIFEEARS